MNYDEEQVLILNDDFTDTFTENYAFDSEDSFLDFLEKILKRRKFILDWYAFDEIGNKNKSKHFSGNFNLLRKYWDNPRYKVGISKLVLLRTKIRFNELW